MSAGKVTAKRYDINTYRLLYGEKLVGFAIQLTNGKWIMTDTEDRVLDGVEYDSPKKVAKNYHAPVN